MSSDKKPPPSSGDSKPSLSQPTRMTHQERFEQEERTLNYILDQVVFLQDLWI